MTELVPGSSNLIWRRFTLVPDEQVAGHSHNYDHGLIVVQGSIEIYARREYEGELVGEPKVWDMVPLTPPSVILKNWHHRIRAGRDGAVYYCVFAARDHNGEVVEAWNGNMHAAR